MNRLALSAGRTKFRHRPAVTSSGTTALRGFKSCSISSAPRLGLGLLYQTKIATISSNNDAIAGELYPGAPKRFFADPADHIDNRPTQALPEKPGNSPKSLKSAQKVAEISDYMCGEPQLGAGGPQACYSVG